MNRGLNLDLERQHQDGTELQFGALSQPGIVSIPLAEREKYLPLGEDQNIGEEKFDCASRSPVNHLAALFTYHYNHAMHPDNKKWLKDKGYLLDIDDAPVDFSDVFVAINSGTTRSGNSLKAPLQAIHSQGLIPKWMLPQLHGFDENYDPKRITQEMRDLGAEFARRFAVTYEQVQSVHFGDVLTDDMVGVAGGAWPEKVNGVYPRWDGQINHAFLLYSLPQFQAFDNYREAPEDYTKNLAPDFKFYDYGYRVILSAEDPNATVKQISLYKQLIAVLLKIRAILIGA
ncbi:hypothetical protein IVB45_02190 [Bradyrhizobium sp. 4]|uniref:hypothetical protein n=1 Tax=Bradyrhizobium sp. 4 TaxID=2782678 RepID=UPI00200051EF|nr:hypothetical protein [Bradyrhizobium sp. 4]UPJ35844.1 hypothetical protein IVB45_02190 [Bradyrhizobium sp. 4]